jgi:hypothetical protein
MSYVHGKSTLRCRRDRGRTCASRQRSPRQRSRRSRRPGKSFCLHQDRNNSTSAQRESLVVQNYDFVSHIHTPKRMDSSALTSQNTCQLSRMTRDRNPRGIIMREDIIKHGPAPNILIRGHFSHQRLPQQILLRKSLLNHICREVVVDISLVATTITSVTRDSFTEQLFDSWDERPVP